MSAIELRHVGLQLGDSGGLSHEEAEHAIFGFWVFLMSDAVIFALLFATYGTMLGATVGGPTAASEFKLGAAFVETLVLLTSSFTFGMAAVAMKFDEGDDHRRLLAWLAVTTMLGLVFIGMELHDFATMIGDGAVPARSGFLSAFFALVSLHGLHVCIGVLWLIVMIVQLLRFGRDARVRLNLLRLGLFWHFLDIVWIAIFSIVYLQGLTR